jgi:hypothetical protein
MRLTTRERRGQGKEGLPYFRQQDGFTIRGWTPRYGFEPEIDSEVPVQVLWPGFALDTAFYAAIAFTLLSAPPAIRRHRRRARGRCPACGYDLNGSTSAVCPECGVTPNGGREGVAEGCAIAAQHTEEVPSASAPAK